MKRSPILRYAEVKRTPLPVRRNPLRSRTPRIRPVSAKRVRQNRERAKAIQVLRAESIRLWGAVLCARCGVETEVHGHERLARSQGGDITRPDCLLCNVCNGELEDNPRMAAETGWKISKKWEAA